MKILIENTVPFNNGDAALIFSIGDKLEGKGYEVIYSTSNIKSAKEKYPKKKWMKSLLAYKVNRSPYLGFFTLFFAFIFNIKLNKIDAVISAPGGYINSYYGFKRKLQLLSLYKKILRKKVYMYSQSVGPLNKKDKKILKKYIDIFDLFYVRDRVSKKRIDELGTFDNVLQTKDAAFLLNSIPKKVSNKRKIAISVREWKHDQRNEGIYKDLIMKFIKYFINRGYSVTLISTCQGDKEYIDDSRTAQNIYNKLDKALKENVFVDTNYYSLYDLREKLTHFDYIIGTRLHMCILSWLSGTPAFNISYEEKGKECYSYLDIDNFSVDYNHQGDLTPLLDEFIEKFDHGKVFKIIKDINNEQMFYFNKLEQNLLNK